MLVLANLRQSSRTFYLCLSANFSVKSTQLILYKHVSNKQMKLYQKLENTIDWNKSVELQLEALSQYDNITEEEIQELAGTCHKWTEAGILLEYLGFEKLRPYLPVFLQFLQDMNWPASGGASRMLLKAGKVIIPEIRRVFNEVQND